VVESLETSGAFEIPKPLDELSPNELVRKAQIGKVGTEVLRYLTSAFTGKGFTWLLPVIFAKSTDPLWPDPGASIESEHDNPQARRMLDGLPEALRPLTEREDRKEGEEGDWMARL